MYADQYLHNPCGSNNRLNEQSANRQNANRLFDSQNNNRGGYNVGDNGENAFTGNGGHDGSTNGDNNIFNKMYNPTVNEADDIQYNMMYTQGSIMRMTWTSQHGCGNGKNNCNMVLQYGCDTEDYTNANFNNLKLRGLGTRMQLKNGGNTQTPNNPNNVNNIGQTFTGNNGGQRGRHESEEWYYYGSKSKRNEGLFTADQNLKGGTKIYTRQNPNGNRRGLEMPEERDYYPYWGVSPWKDIAWLGNDVDYCNKAIKPESQNVKGKFVCVNKQGNGPDLDNLRTDAVTAAQTETECDTAGGFWYEYVVEGAKELDCSTLPFTQVNNLGNVDGSARGGQTQAYVWEVPRIADLKAQGCHIYNDGVGSARPIQGNNPKFARIVVRTRYNISTMDYDPYETNATSNQNLKLGVISPIQQNPTVDTGAHMQGLKLAINTAQTGRTFQDRSHVILVMEQENAPAAQTAEMNMLNVNVRGKRGNIVQTFPAVEYDFEPNDFEMERDQCVHFQWDGSNTHNNGNPGGDGQTGDAGEGKGGSDRSNIAEVRSMRTSYPVPYDKTTDTFFDNSECRWCLNGQVIPPSDAKIVAASGGYYSSEASIAGKTQLNVLLNNAPASFRQGMCCCAKKEGVYNFISTRNNNFSNRSQKLHIVVKPKTNKANAEKWEFFPAKDIQTNNPTNKVKTI